MEINLTIPQSTIFACTSRYRTAVAGRRFGKTFLAAIELLQAAVEKSGANVWYVAPTYRMAKMIIWPELKAIIPRHLIEKTNEQELMITLVKQPGQERNSIIVCKGVDNPDSLRGASISFIVLDEFQDQDPDAWNLVLRPACADQRARALFIGTPKGFNHFYDFSLKGGVDPGWESFHYTTAEGGMVDEEEIEMARHDMGPRQFAQEFLASFETLNNRVIYTFDRKRHLRSNLEWNYKDTLHIGLDFNVAIMAGAVAYVPSGTNDICIFDEIGLENSNTQEVCEMVVDRYHTANIIFYPDPSGRSRKTSAMGGETDHSIIKSFGWKVIAPRKHLGNADGFSNVNAAFTNAANENHMWLHPRCKGIIKSCEGWTYKDNTDIPDKSGGLDHHGDGIKYLVNQLKPVKHHKFKMAKVLGF